MSKYALVGLSVAVVLILSPVATLAAEIRVIDGDSFVTEDDVTVRVDNIDTPSTGASAQCFAEREMGTKTVDRVKSLLAECPPVLDKRYTDGRGRTVARVEVCGDDLGEILMKEGLATPRDVPPIWCSTGAQ